LLHENITHSRTEATALILRYHELADRTIDVSFFGGNGGKKVQGYRRIDRTLKVRSFLEV